jgi:hypothetical protein
VLPCTCLVSPYRCLHTPKHSPSLNPSSNRYDDLSNYTNERSLWLAKLRDTIEEPWQEWELGQLLASPDVAQGVAQGSLEGYRGLSVDTLKETFKDR